MSEYIVLGYAELALAASLLIVNAALSVWLELRLERRYLFAAARMVVQLLLVGLVLKALFAATSPWWTLLAAVVMGTFAGREVFARQERPFSGAWGIGLGAATMTIAGATIMILALTLVIRAEPWYDPRFALPMFGMVLGNAMTGIALGLNTLTTAIVRDRAAVEAQLLLGETRWHAMLPVTRRAMVNGLMPIVNAMAATGVVSLPGMMTGQILAGVDPTEAVKYQLLVMFLIAGATGLGVLLSVVMAVRRLSDDRHRLRLDRLAAARDL